MRRDFSERADDRVSVARTEHENRLGLPFASRTLVFPFADGLREFFCVLRLWGNRATVEIRPDCRAGLPYFCSIRNRYVLDRGMVGRLPLKRMSRRSVGKSADDKRDRPCRFVSLPLQAVRRGEGLAQMPRFDSGAIDRAALGNGIVFFI